MFLAILGISNNTDSIVRFFITFLAISERQIHATLINWRVILLFGAVGWLFC